ncbi:MAG: hypothetical protein EBR28_00455 [Planctomycetia bacterium]|nr:hypothetical protein [Planctomycetia bacterium]
MSTQADVKSLDTLAFVKAALAAYAHESAGALDEIELEGRKAVDYITVDQAAFWKAEVRRCNDLVNQAIKDLEHCRAFKKVGDNQPSCAEEKKALEKARAKLARAERKAEAVRRWTPVVLQQFRETCVRLVHFREVVDVDCPKAIARVERMLRSLEAYGQLSGPRPDSTDAAGGSAAAVTRQIEEAPSGTSAAPVVDDAGAAT